MFLDGLRKIAMEKEEEEKDGKMLCALYRAY